VKFILTRFKKKLLYQFNLIMGWFMKKAVLVLAVLGINNIAFAATDKPQCDNSSLTGDYNAKIYGVKNGNSIAGHYHLKFDGKTDPITKVGTFKSEAFDSVFTDGIKMDGGYKNSKKGNVYLVADEGCWVSISISPTEKDEDRFTISIDLTEMNILKKPYTANRAIGAFLRNGVGYSFEMTRWVQVK
jgi:hypothetical protein